ncbi:MULTISPECIES: aconitate hydratase [Thermoanaerobacter]|uniref:Aconitate hydratase n=2 Tax=Thermoanaerobacter TaxID=1754 RepID=E8UWE8_THEBF|nr:MULTISPECIES: aconitate hydratase [Thermoanaerobacter]ABY91726.1 putative aconitate hydratase [Thermoanaerobacter sp. X514]ABY95455.1 putative aconitate hydratase [Thermoanaerobacter pseudethanolicus ATCC 33223]ADV80399.1 aconitate hydratase [Thermoanaerobacter brockii subsp. finnii Ako-1]HBW59323.1 aconitate hydratase [Thermoanaerobacter sp.]
MNLTQKILSSHLIEGEMVKGQEIAIKIDQTLTQDSTGTMAYLQLEALGIDRVKTELSVAYIDHNTLQQGPENADDHKYIQTVAAKYGIYFSRPGNGICHQVHLERFGRPGKTLLGSDSHTPTAGGLGMLAIGAGGLDVALAMAGEPYRIIMPSIVNVRLTGKLRPWVSAKDVILELLRRLTVKGGVGKIFEYSGDGVKTLSVPERATIANMGAELGATTSIFPSDERTYEFLKAQGREEVFVPLAADEDAEYDEVIEINLDELEPLVALPHSPDNVVKVKDAGRPKVDQVAIGSCTNSSYADLMKVASILRGKVILEHVSLVIAPGSRQVLNMLAKNGALSDLISAGARILESACGPCIGMGQAPATGAISIRTFNRNFYGRSGTKSASVYLVSPEVAAAAALTGYLIDPRELGEAPEVPYVEKFEINDNMIIKPPEDREKVEIIKGPNIKPFPLNTPLSDIEKRVLIKVGDDITTDHIMPSNAKLLPLRSNIPELAKHCFEIIDENFSKRAIEWGGGIIVGGSNYGQGSSREHAALAPLQLGVKAVIAKSFARIHKANLINSGILPLTFVDEKDYEDIEVGDVLKIENAVEQVRSGKKIIIVNVTKGKTFEVTLDVSDRNREILIAGGMINFVKSKKK